MDQVVFQHGMSWSRTHGMIKDRMNISELFVAELRFTVLRVTVLRVAVLFVIELRVADRVQYGIRPVWH